MPVVYRHFDSDGSLLYVGCTSNYGRRLRQHSCETVYWSNVATITLSHFYSPKTALREEKRAILLEHPKFNVLHNPEAPRRSEMINKEIRAKIRSGNDFNVKTVSERKRALMIANVLKIEIITRRSKRGGFRIFIPSDVPN